MVGGVLDDVGGVQEAAVVEAADGAPGLVGADHASPELGLMEPLLDDAFGVAPLRGVLGEVARQEADALVQREEELALSAQVVDHIHGHLGDEQQPGRASAAG